MISPTVLAAIQKYATLAAAVATGVASIAAKNYSAGIEQILQAIAVVFGGAAAVQLHQAVSNVPDATIEAAARNN